MKTENIGNILNLNTSLKDLAALAPTEEPKTPKTKKLQTYYR
jgi:hypothetical protein